MTQQIVRIDGIKWWILEKNGFRTPQPLCPDHDLRITMNIIEIFDSDMRRRRLQNENEVKKLKCAEGPHFFNIPQGFRDEKQYVIDRIDAKVLKNMQVVDLDGELTPIAKQKLKSKDDKYFITTQLMESKRGLQVVVYAGEKGSNRKTQIFVEPEIKRLAFDQKDLNPSDVFLEINAIFNDGSNHKISKE